MVQEEKLSFDPELVHRYFDGETSAEESRQAEASLEVSEDARAMLAGLERQRALFGATGDSWRASLDAGASDALFARIEAAIDADVAVKPAAPLPVVKPGLRLIPGGLNRTLAAATVVLAAAAALAFWVIGSVEQPGNVPAIAAHLRGSEVIAVDFGQNAGTTFHVEGTAGEELAVVWISDQVVTQ